MNVEQARNFLLTLPHVVEDTQWGALVYWVGDKAIGGKMFAVLDADRQSGRLLSFPVSPERFAELTEQPGFLPAPYLARLHWVAATAWDALRHAEWHDELHAAHAITLAKLTAGTRRTLELPRAELKRATAERRKLLAARKAASHAAKV